MTAKTKPAKPAKPTKTKPAPRTPPPKATSVKAPEPEKQAIASYDKPIAITPIEMGAFQTAFDHFNKELFEGVLPYAHITMRARANSAGYFSPDRFVYREGGARQSEIALNCDAFPERTDKAICSVLAHEMIHFLQHARGTRRRAAITTKSSLFWRATSG